MDTERVLTIGLLGVAGLAFYKLVLRSEETDDNNPPNDNPGRGDGHYRQRSNNRFDTVYVPGPNDICVPDAAVPGWSLCLTDDGRSISRRTTPYTEEQLEELERSREAWKATLREDPYLTEPAPPNPELIQRWRDDSQSYTDEAAATLWQMETITPEQLRQLQRIYSRMSPEERDRRLERLHHVLVERRPGGLTARQLRGLARLDALALLVRADLWRDYAVFRGLTRRRDSIYNWHRHGWKRVPILGYLDFVDAWTPPAGLPSVYIAPDGGMMTPIFKIVT